MPETADDYRKQGNKYYQHQRYPEAIEAYGKAIAKNPNVSTYYTNRALTYIQTKAYKQACADCNKALECDKNSVKGFYFWGRAALNMQNYDEAIKLLVKANDLAISQKMSYGDEIACLLRIARRDKFRQEENQRIKQEIATVTYLERLIDEDVSRRSLSESPEETMKVIAEGDETKMHINDMLAQVDERRRRREIPDFLCGKISFELMRDPVITPSGITYDRSDIKQHLQRVGHFDPVTRTPLSEDELIPNLAMKEVIENFLVENPWAEFEDLND